MADANPTTDAGEKVRSDLEGRMMVELRGELDSITDNPADQKKVAEAIAKAVADIGQDLADDLSRKATDKMADDVAQQELDEMLNDFGAEPVLPEGVENMSALERATGDGDVDIAPRDVTVPKQIYHATAPESTKIEAPDAKAGGVPATSGGATPKQAGSEAGTGATPAPTAPEIPKVPADGAAPPVGNTGAQPPEQNPTSSLPVESDIPKEVAGTQAPKSDRLKEKPTEQPGDETPENDAPERDASPEPKKDAPANELSDDQTKNAEDTAQKKPLPEDVEAPKKKDYEPLSEPETGGENDDDQKKKTSEDDAGENGEEDSEENEDGAEENQPKQAGPERSRSVQAINALRFRRQLAEIVQKIQELEKQSEQPRKRLKEINKQARPLRIMKRTIQARILWQIVKMFILLFIVLPILAIITLGTYLGPAVAHVTKISLKIGKLSKDLRDVKHKLSALEKEAKTKQKELDNIGKHIRKLYAEQRRLKNKSLLSREQS